MPQLQIPLFPEGPILIIQNIGFLRQGTCITYTYGNLPVFTHDIDSQAQQWSGALSRDWMAMFP